MKSIHIKLFIVLFSLLPLLLTAQVEKGNNVVKTEIRDLKGYTKVVAQGRFQLILSQGDEEGIRIETDENLINLFQTRMDGKTLFVIMMADVKKYKELNVYVSIKDIEQLTLLNEISVKTDKLIHFSDVSILASGMSKVEMELFSSRLTVELTDGSYTYLKGYTERFLVRAHDETELNAFDLQADFCYIKSSGLTEVMINAEKELSLMVTGESNVYYIGEPTIKERIFSSSGFIVKRKRGDTVPVEKN